MANGAVEQKNEEMLTIQMLIVLFSNVPLQHLSSSIAETFYHAIKVCQGPIAFTEDKFAFFS